VTKVEGTKVLSLDFVLISSILKDVWEGREEYSWQDRLFPAVSAEGMAKMERLANRDQDRVNLKRLGWDGGQTEPNA